MRRRADGTALITGLLALLIAVIALWTAFGTVSWADASAFIPLVLVAFGLIGLFASHSRP